MLGITFIFVTHDQEEALTMSDRIAVFNEGKIEQVGTPSEIYERPAIAIRGGVCWHVQSDQWGSGKTDHRFRADVLDPA